MNSTYNGRSWASMLHSVGMKTRIFTALLPLFACTSLLAQDPAALLDDNISDWTLPLANLYRHRVQDGETQYARERVFELYTGVGEWQDFVIRVEGTTLSVELNGELVTEAKNLENLQGYIGFQSEKGVVEFRNLLIHEH